MFLVHSFIPTFWAVAAILSLTTQAAYVLQDDYSGPNFFPAFDFFTGTDPTHGFVTYLSQADAQAQGLISTAGSSVYIGVDHTNPAPNGRASVRVSSKKRYNHGLIVLDLAHMPGSICGTWPAFWTMGPDQPWPAYGEVDIIEGVHTSTVNDMALHTSDGCSILGVNQTGGATTTNCFVGASGQASNAGCGIQASGAATYGTPFNQAGGGVYATEWTSDFVKIWYFPRNAIPADIASGLPNPTTWPLPQANFAGACNIDMHILNQVLTFDTTFCGDYAGNVWAATPQCASKTATCQDYVNANPGDFSESYWAINSLKVYGDSQDTLIGMKKQSTLQLHTT